VFEGVFTQCSTPDHKIVNRNGRIYMENEVLRHLGYLRDMIKENNGRILGELDHPEGRFEVSMKEASHMITDLWYDQNTHCVMGRLEVLDTPNGKTLKSLIEAGFPLYVSSPADFEKEKQKSDKPKTRDVYLPSGANWVDYWTGKNYEGGKSYTFDAPIEKIPILVKQGSILPLGPEVQYADENPFGELEIRVYQGADGEFLLYEDEGDNLNYQSGKYSLIKFTYTEANKKLKILKREGGFDGMKQERVFKITTGEKVVQTVNYKGDEVEISL
jgi:hypothetical protein